MASSNNEVTSGGEEGPRSGLRGHSHDPNEWVSVKAGGSAATMQPPDDGTPVLLVEKEGVEGRKESVQEVSDGDEVHTTTTKLAGEAAKCEDDSLSHGDSAVEKDILQLYQPATSAEETPLTVEWERNYGLDVFAALEASGDPDSSSESSTDGKEVVQEASVVTLSASGDASQKTTVKENVETAELNKLAVDGHSPGNVVLLAINGIVDAEEAVEEPKNSGLEVARSLDVGKPGSLDGDKSISTSNRLDGKGAIATSSGNGDVDDFATLLTSGHVDFTSTVEISADVAATTSDSTINLPSSE